MVRKVDELGRIVIPIEIRDLLAINCGDGLEVLVRDGEVVLRKYTAFCFVCNGITGVEKHNKAHLCEKCREKLFEEKPVSA